MLPGASLLGCRLSGSQVHEARIQAALEDADRLIRQDQRQQQQQQQQQQQANSNGSAAPAAGQQQQQEEGLLLAQQVARAEAALRRFVLLQWLWFDARCKKYAREVSEVLALPLPALVQPSVL
jgi:hypothetical protein